MIQQHADVRREPFFLSSSFSSSWQGTRESHASGGLAVMHTGFPFSFLFLPLFISLFIFLSPFLYSLTRDLLASLMARQMIQQHDNVRTRNTSASFPFVKRLCILPGTASAGWEGRPAASGQKKSGRAAGRGPSRVIRGGADRPPGAEGVRRCLADPLRRWRHRLPPGQQLSNSHGR